MLNWFKKRKNLIEASHVSGYNKLLQENRPEYVAQLRNELADNTLNGMLIISKLRI